MGERNGEEFYLVTFNSKRLLASAESNKGSVKVMEVNDQSVGGVNIEGFEQGLSENQVRELSRVISNTPDIIEEADSYSREIGDCALDCNQHWINGTSMKFNSAVSSVSQAVVIAAIISVLASTGSGAIASLFGNKFIETIVGTVMEDLVGNSLTIAYYDFDLDYVVDAKQIMTGGYALGPWQPGTSALLPMGATPGHSAQCDYV